MRDIASYSGLRIVWDVNALEATTERLFPKSRHRSKRIRKKLIKRFGGEFRMQPCIFRTPHLIIAHPAYRERLTRALQQAEGSAP